MGFFEYLLPTTWTGVAFFLLAFSGSVALNIFVYNNIGK